MAAEEPHVTGSLAALCRTLAIRCVVQVGAEDGYEAWCIKEEVERCGSVCRAVAIDADPKCGPYKGVEWHEALIGDHDAKFADFYIYAKGLSSAIKRGDEDSSITLPMYRLDTFCWGIAASPDALIIDTEGTTLDVLHGSTGIIDGVRLVYAECGDRNLRPGYNAAVEDVDAFLLERGFIRRPGLPAYNAGGQGNYAWVRP